MCDTFIIPASAASDGSALFGKNSDREPGEAQHLVFLPERPAPRDGRLRCTHISIDRRLPRQAVLLSRPFWMWGAEMGANQRGVVIGNEAVWSRIPVNRKPALTGMDLLRIALESATSAEEAVEDIVRLLHDHGQGGGCGFRDRRMTYHNSFLIADPASTWVLETVGKLWAARRLHAAYAISNTLTIGREYDRSHPDLESTARRKGWIEKGAPFHFARAYSDRFYTFFSASRRRQRRARQLAEQLSRCTSPTGAFALLRDHGDLPPGEYRVDRHLLGSTLCAHAGLPLTRAATQTVGSMVAHLQPGNPTFWFTGTAAPCTATFKPVRFGTSPLPPLGPPPGDRFDDSLWWQHEQLHRRLIIQRPSLRQSFAMERDALEGRFVEGNRYLGPTDISAFTRDCFEKGRRLTESWLPRLGTSGKEMPTAFLYRRFWKHENRISAMPMNP
jgi:secernin